MSESIQATRELPERAVRNSSQFAGALHRPDPDADDPRPACPEADRPGADFSEVSVSAYRTYDRCRNPECFGGDWR